SAVKDTPFPARTFIHQTLFLGLFASLSQADVGSASGAQYIRGRSARNRAPARHPDFNYMF
ncbi:MAG TPA: hypothetical protein VIY07_10265, partial [Pseudolabrys sp.]